MTLRHLQPLPIAAAATAVTFITTLVFTALMTTGITSHEVDYLIVRHPAERPAPVTSLKHPQPHTSIHSHGVNISYDYRPNTHIAPAQTRHHLVDSNTREYTHVQFERPSTPWPTHHTAPLGLLTAIFISITAATSAIALVAIIVHLLRRSNHSRNGANQSAKASAR